MWSCSFRCVSSISKDGCWYYFWKSIIFRGLIRRGSFPECWWSANVTAIPKGAPSPGRENCLPKSITPILSKVYEKFVSHKHSSFCKKFVFLPAAQFAHRKGLGCTDALLTISHHLQKSLDARMESYISQLDFSAAFDWVSHSDLLFKLKFIVVGGSVLSICREFLFNRRQRVMVDGVTSEWIPIVSGVRQGSVWVLFCSSFIPVKCLSWSRTDYICLCRWLHITGSCSQARRQICCCCLP